VNGVHPYELQEFGLEAVPEEVRQNLQRTPHYYNSAWVTVEIPGGLTVTDYTEIVDITFRPTNLTGTSEIITYASWDVGEEWHSFDLEIPGQIVTNGGGSYPSLGEFRAPSATIDAGSQKVLPIMVRSLNNADSAYFWAKWNSTIINVTSLSLNATAQNAGVTLDSWWSYSDTYEPTGYLRAYLGNMSSLNTASWTPVLDLTVKANATGQTPVNISGSVYMYPRENVTIMYPAASIENGVISVIVPEKADFTANITAGPAPLTVRFTDTSTGDPTAWSWTFGDGATSAEQNPTHTYVLPGNYTVSLSVNGGAETCTKPGYIKVTPLLFGDANEDGEVNQADTLLVLQEVVGIREKPLAGTGRFTKTDVHANGAIEIGDALFIAQYNVGLRDPWFALSG